MGWKFTVGRNWLILLGNLTGLSLNDESPRGEKGTDAMQLVISNIDPLVDIGNFAPVPVSAEQIALWVRQGAEDAVDGRESPYTEDSVSGYFWKVGNDLFQPYGVVAER